jgi:hypothetical protein
MLISAHEIDIIILWFGKYFDWLFDFSIKCLLKGESKMVDSCGM